MNKLLILTILLIFTGCNKAVYKNVYNKNDDKKININSLKENNEAIVIFTDNLQGAQFVNLDDVKHNIEFTREADKKKLFPGMVSSEGINIIKVKPGLYVFTEGLFSLGYPRQCIWHTLVAISLFFLELPGTRYTQPFIYDDKLDKTIPAVMYFEIKPGDISYIGNLDYRFFHCDIDVKNDFIETKDKLYEQVPNIYHTTKENILKKIVKPESCGSFIGDAKNPDKLALENKQCMLDIKKQISEL